MRPRMLRQEQDRDQHDRKPHHRHSKPDEVRLQSAEESRHTPDRRPARQTRRPQRLDMWTEHTRNCHQHRQIRQLPNRRQTPIPPPRPTIPPPRHRQRKTHHRTSLSNRLPNHARTSGAPDGAPAPTKPLPPTTAPTLRSSRASRPSRPKLPFRPRFFGRPHFSRARLGRHHFGPRRANRRTDGARHAHRAPCRMPPPCTPPPDTPWRSRSRTAAIASPARIPSYAPTLSPRAPAIPPGDCALSAPSALSPGV